MLRLNFPALFLIALMIVAHLVARPFDELTKAHRVLQWLELGSLCVCWLTLHAGSFRIALGGNSRRESALPFRGPRKIGPAVPTLTLARRTRRNPSFRPLGPARVVSPTLLSHGEVIESIGGRQDPLENHAPTETVKDNSSWLYWDFLLSIDSGIFFCPMEQVYNSSKYPQ